MDTLVFDTDVLIDHLRGYSSYEDLLENVEDGTITGYISVITEMELFAGRRCDDESERKRLTEFLSIFEIIPADSEVARLAGKLKRKYNCSLPDALIAATTLLKKSNLVTRNTGHFEAIKELALYKKPS